VRRHAALAILGLAQGLRNHRLQRLRQHGADHFLFFARKDVDDAVNRFGGALLCTVTGMIVAIPSMIGYNLLTINIRSVIVRMDNFVEEFMARVNLEQLEADKAKE
jgi:hypothetical protein